MDAVDLREFYGSRLGHVVRRLIAERLQARAAPHPGSTVLGFGFPIPYLAPPEDDSGRNLVFMMARQGVLRWPADGPAATALVDEFNLPLLESTVDFAVVVHALELSDSPGDLLDELWRVLAPQGRLLLVVPNRRGLWASSDATPFGHGQPFSRPQLSTLLKSCQFSPIAWSQALFMPPTARRLIVRSAPAWERVGAWLWPGFAGAIIVEAVKQIYAVPTAKRARRFIPRLQPALQPQAALPFANAAEPAYEGRTSGGNGKGSTGGH